MTGKRTIVLIATLFLITLTGAGVASARAVQDQRAAAPETGCDGTIFGTFRRFDSLESLAWASDQVIVGTVVAQQSARWVNPHPIAAPEYRQIYTDYLVRVERRFRGLPVDTVRIRRLGGTLDGCTLTNASEPTLAVGERVLLFAHLPVADTAGLSYMLESGMQARWDVAADGTLTARAGHLRAAESLSLTQAEARIRAALTGSAPTDLHEFLVPLDLAPQP